MWPHQLRRKTYYEGWDGTVRRLGLVGFTTITFQRISPLGKAGWAYQTDFANWAKREISEG